MNSQILLSVGTVTFFLIFFVWGSARGLIPALITLIGQLISIIIGFFAAKIAGFLGATIFHLPPYFIEVSVGLLVWMICSGVVMGMGFFLYRPFHDVVKEFVHDAEHLFIRLAYGFFGGVVGVTTAALILWGAVSLLIVTGNEVRRDVAESKFPPNAVQKVILIASQAVQGNNNQELLDAAVELKFRAEDVTEEIATTVSTMIQVNRDPVALERLKQAPDVRRLMAHPTIQEILNDESLAKASAEKDYATLIKNPLLLKLVSDLDLLRELGRTDFKRALDFVAEKEPWKPPGSDGNLSMPRTPDQYNAMHTGESKPETPLNQVESTPAQIDRADLKANQSESP